MLLIGCSPRVGFADLSHYLDDAAAQRRDRATAEAIERLDFKRFGPRTPVVSAR